MIGCAREPLLLSIEYTPRRPGRVAARWCSAVETAANSPAREESTLAQRGGIQAQMRRVLPVLLLLAASARSQQPGAKLLGQWREPGGSVIRISPCGEALCLAIAGVRPDAPSAFDIHNPDASAHTRALCGLTIGRGFRATAADHAEGGELYDPKSGHTYHGEMTAEGDRLHLRGYVGVRLFGRSETWTRTTALPCSKAVGS